MSYKVSTTVYHAKSCPDVTFRLHSKTYGRKIELDRRIAEYNPSIRGLFNQRAQLLEQARAKAAESLGLNRAESTLKIGASGEADRLDPQDTPRFQAEMLRHLDQEKTYQIGDEIESRKLSSLRPLYMDVYLHSCSGVVLEDDTAIEYRQNMSMEDKDRFFTSAPAELIDEIFTELDSRIGMTEVERANFGLPTTGGAQGPGSIPDTSAAPANRESSGETVSADSPKS